MTGTHQYEKHVLVLRTIVEEIKKPSTILFRANSMQNLDAIFKNNSTNFKTGMAYRAGKHSLYVDTINPSSWKNTKSQYDYAILYPLDSVLKCSNKQEILRISICIETSGKFSLFLGLII